MTRGLSRIHQVDVIGMLWWYSFYATKWKSISSSTTSTPISQVLGQPEASHTPEKIFSRGAHVLNKFRTSLLCARSEKLILSLCRFCFKLFGNDCFNIPTCGQLFTTEEINQVQENQERGSWDSRHWTSGNWSGNRLCWRSWSRWVIHWTCVICNV